MRLSVFTVAFALLLLAAAPSSARAQGYDGLIAADSGSTTDAATAATPDTSAFSDTGGTGDSLYGTGSGDLYDPGAAPDWRAEARAAQAAKRETRPNKYAIDREQRMRGIEERQARQAEREGVLGGSTSGEGGGGFSD